MTPRRALIYAAWAVAAWIAVLAIVCVGAALKYGLGLGGDG